MKPRIASLFCGCGGLDLGFVNAGAEIAFACDNDQAAISCYKRNIGKHVFNHDVTSKEFRSQIETLENIDVVLGGFPCQGFSKAGPKRESDSRNILYRQMKWAVKTLRPKVFVAENVDGISQNFQGIYLKKIKSEFRRIGYEVEYRIFDAVTFGLPQFRRRIVFIGYPKDCSRSFDWPIPTHQKLTRNGDSHLPDHPLWDKTPKHLVAANTIRDAIGDLKETSSGISDHITTESWPPKYNAVIRAISEGQKLCNVRHADTAVRTWDIPDVFGKVTKRQVLILETIAKYRRHKKYGAIPNGNPIPKNEIERLTSRKLPSSDFQYLLGQGYLKEKADGYDLKGAMFCSGLFKRPKWDEPSPTILTVFHNPRYLLHPSENRPFTLRECARLQGFPDSFIISDDDPNVSITAGYRLIGNAVPPPLAEAVATSVMKFLQQVQCAFV